MGTICILLGVIVLILAVLGGFFAAHQIIAMITTNELYKTLLAIENPASIYLYVVGACFAVGLLICLGLVMHGMTYNKVCKNNAMLKRITRS